jgi:hypothetical protein
VLSHRLRSAARMGGERPCVKQKQIKASGSSTCQKSRSWISCMTYASCCFGYALLLSVYHLRPVEHGVQRELVEYGSDSK